MLCFVPCCEVQQIFFSGSPWVGVGLSELWILKKSAMKMVIFTIIVVITSNLIRKITLNMLFSVPCCEVHQIFFFWLSIVMRSAITTLKLKEVSTVNGMFPELQTALSIFQKQVAIAGNGFPFTLFQDFFSTFCGFCRLTPNGCTFEFPMGTSYESGASTERGEAASRCA